MSCVGSFAPTTAGLAAQHGDTLAQSAVLWTPDEAPVHMFVHALPRPALSVPFRGTRRCQSEAVSTHPIYAAGCASGDAERRARANWVHVVVDNEKTEKLTDHVFAFLLLAHPVIQTHSKVCCDGRDVGHQTRGGGRGRGTWRRQDEAAEVKAEAMRPNWDKRVGVGKCRARIPHMRLPTRRVRYSFSTATHFHYNTSA